MKTNNTLLIFFVGFLLTINSLFAQFNQRNNKVVPVKWTTTADQSKLLVKQNLKYISAPSANIVPIIELNPNIKYQEVDGFGYTLTGGSADLISQMDAPSRKKLLLDLFGKQESSIAISCLRISIGASDLDKNVFSYDDLSLGDSDLKLKKFSLAQDTIHLIPLLKQILKINPSLTIIASPWSPPVWMKSNQSTKGGHLLKEYYGVYADYFVRYIREMKRNAIPIHAVTIQNEPHHGGNNPSMVMEADEEASFIKTYLGPGFKRNGIDTKIIVWDHNCDEPNYPINVYKDSAANRFVDGAAFHLYNGDIAALSSVHDAFPKKNLYFTEQWTGKNGTFAGDLMWHMKNVVIGSMNNWSRTALEWNLASDPTYSIHTPGGCTECLGALTIDHDEVKRNVSYYIIAHASKFVPSRSVRIHSSALDGLSSVAFITPHGKKVLIVLNESNQKKQFQIKMDGKTLLDSMLPQSVSTYIL